MALDIERLLAYAIPDNTMTYTARDTILYALGLGLGRDPIDERQLRFVYETNLLALPMMATIIAAPHAWIRKADVGTGGKSVHAGISFKLNRPLPVEGSFVSRNTVAEVVDKGSGKAALITTRREIFAEGGAAPICEVLSTSMSRGDGGFGGKPESSLPLRPMPTRPADVSVDYLVEPRAGLIYRLSGDQNPLHVDPEAARRAGFDRPILHGLCTYGMAGWALLDQLCDADPARLRAMSGRFSNPVYPGEVLRFEIWQELGDVRFRGSAPARQATVIDYGEATIRAAGDEA